MKAIKRILIVITLLIATFFVTGLVIKETKYTTQVIINKDINEVFNLITSVDSIQKWNKDIKSVEVMKENPNVSGSIYKMIANNKGYDVAMTQKVIVYIPNQKVTYFYDADDMLKTDEYVFTILNNKTTITKSTSCKSNSYIMSCIFPYFRWTLEEIDQAYLDSFKDYIESKS